MTALVFSHRTFAKAPESFCAAQQTDDPFTRFHSNLRKHAVWKIPTDAAFSTRKQAPPLRRLPYLPNSAFLDTSSTTSTVSFLTTALYNSHKV